MTPPVPIVMAVAAIITIAGCASAAPPEVLDRSNRFEPAVQLPVTATDGDVSLESALTARRSRREFGTAQLDERILGQLLWAGQGITDSAGHRTAPSAGALYPIELYAVTSDEVMHYLPDGHRLARRRDRQVLAELGDAAFGQDFAADAALVLVLVAVPARTELKYGAVADALIDREAGHVAQNILLQATALDLAAVPVGGFDPPVVGRLLALPPGHDVRYLIPMG